MAKKQRPGAGPYWDDNAVKVYRNPLVNEAGNPTTKPRELDMTDDGDNGGFSAPLPKPRGD
jgi:hypothetical protein